MPSSHQSDAVGVELPSPFDALTLAQRGPTPIQTIALDRLGIPVGVGRKINPRSIFALAARIRSSGQLRSLMVVLGDNAQYYVVAGERRFAALQLLVKQGCISRSFLVPCRVIATSLTVDLSGSDPGAEADEPRQRFLDLRKRCPGMVTGAELAARHS